MNKMLMEKARSMLNGVGLSQEFWVEVAYNTCHLVNQLPTITLVNKTIHETWTHKKPSLKHLKVFDCDVYVHVL